MAHTANEHRREQPLGGSLCARQDTARCRAGAAERTAKVLPEQLHHCTEHGCGLLSNTGAVGFSNTFSWPIFTCPLVALPVWYIPCNTPYFLAYLCNSVDPLFQLLISSSAHRQAGGCAPISSVSQHSAIPCLHPTALPYMSSPSKKRLSFTPSILAPAVEVTG